MSVCLGPGDVLYIPRGFAHHAATGPGRHSKRPRLRRPLGCVLGMGRKEARAKMVRIQPAEWQGGSLHVTFGVEVEAPFE